MDDGHHNEKEAGFSALVTACFALNYIIGTGILTLPYAFHEGGLILSTTAMVLVCAAANASSDYLLSAMARAEGIASHLGTRGTPRGASKVASLERGASEGGASLDRSISAKGDDEERPNASSSACSVDEISHLAARGHDAVYGSTDTNRLLVPIVFSGSEDLKKPDNVDEKGNLLVGDQQYDVPELCHIFLGKSGFQTYSIMIGCYLYGLLCAFTCVFGTAMSRVIPIFGEDLAYQIWVLVFATIVVPMSFLELSEQVIAQVFLSGCRYLMIFIMIVTPLAASLLIGNEGPFQDATGADDAHFADGAHFGFQTKPAGAPLFCFSGMHHMLPIMVLSTVFHHSIPGLSNEVAKKSELGSVFGLTMSICGIAYSCIGDVGAWYFGEGIETSSNINWDEYHAGTGHFELDHDDEEWQLVDVAWWANAVSLYVVIFPASDVVSSFPLNSLCLGSALMGAYYGADIHEVEHSRRVKTVFRSIACVPPIIGALFARDLGKITSYAGFLGLAVAFCFPAMLYISSERKLKKLGINAHTHYERFGSSFRGSVCVFMFGAVSVLLVFLGLVFKG